MNRYIISAGVLVIGIVVIAAGAVFFLGSSKNTQSPSTGVTSPVIVPASGVGSNVSVSAPQNAQSTTTVQSVFEIAMAPYSSDHIQLYQTVIANGYALQLWKGDTMGGEGLLEYDPNQAIWNVVTDGGGAWTVDDLVAAGVPRATATILLAGMPQ